MVRRPVLAACLAGLLLGLPSAGCAESSDEVAAADAAAEAQVEAGLFDRTLTHLDAAALELMDELPDALDALAAGDGYAALEQLTVELDGVVDEAEDLLDELQVPEGDSAEAYLAAFKTYWELEVDVAGRLRALVAEAREQGWTADEFVARLQAALNVTEEEDRLKQEVVDQQQAFAEEHGLAVVPPEEAMGAAGDGAGGDAAAAGEGAGDPDAGGDG